MENKSTEAADNLLRQAGMSPARIDYMRGRSVDEAIDFSFPIISNCLEKIDKFLKKVPTIGLVLIVAASFIIAYLKQHEFPYIQSEFTPCKETFQMIQNNVYDYRIDQNSERCKASYSALIDNMLSSDYAIEGAALRANRTVFALSSIAVKRSSYNFFPDNDKRPAIYITSSSAKEILTFETEVEADLVFRKIYSAISQQKLSTSESGHNAN